MEERLLEVGSVLTIGDISYVCTRLIHHKETRLACKNSLVMETELESSICQSKHFDVFDEGDLIEVEYKGVVLKSSGSQKLMVYKEYRIRRLDVGRIRETKGNRKSAVGEDESTRGRDQDRESAGESSVGKNSDPLHTPGQGGEGGEVGDSGAHKEGVHAAS